MPGPCTLLPVAWGAMPSSTSSAGFDEMKHPRGQPDNPGKFRGKPIPAPPSPGRRRPATAPMLSTPTSDIPLAVYDALVVVTDWLRDTAQDGPREALLGMRIEGHGEPLSVAGHLTRQRPTQEGEADPEGQLLSIKVRITDSEALSAPTPERMRSYLESRGWECHREETLQREWWALPSQEGAYEVLMPSSKAARDYPKRVSELLRTVSIAENRSELALWHDLVSS